MSKNRENPPKLAEILMWLFLSRADYDQLVGDFQEIYEVIKEEKNKRTADWWYWFQLIKCVPNFTIFSIFWGGNMLKNYFKIAIRNIMKHKGYAFINIVGLAIGLASCILIMLFVIDEMSYDKYHENSDRIYRLERKGNYKGQDFHAPVTGHAYGPSFKAEIPEVEEVTRIDKMKLSIVDEKNNTNQEEFYFADENLFSMFSFKLKVGDKKNVLSEPNSVVLTEAIAEKYFGTVDVIGERLKIEWNKKIVNLNITGLMEKIPPNSHFSTEIFTSYSTLEILFGKEAMNQWVSNSMYTYAMLQKGVTVESIRPKINEWFESHVGKEIKKILGNDIDFNKLMQLHIRPIEEIHLFSNLQYEIAPQGDIKKVTIFFGVSILILIIACINFMNLSTARSSGRAKEVGLRKVVGATKKYLMNQFLAESIFLATVGLIIGILLVEITLPWFNGLTLKSMSFNYFENPVLLLTLILIAIITGVGAGIYPAIFLSSFQPAKVLQGTSKSGTGGKTSKLRNGLVIFQFVITITLMISTVTLIQQMSYMKNKDLGFDKEQIAIVKVDDEELSSKLNLLITELQNNSNIINATISTSIPGGGSWSDNAFKLKEASKDDFEMAVYHSADVNYVPTMNIEILSGRNFSKKYSTDEQTGVLINEKLMKKLGFINPNEVINKSICTIGQREGIEYKVIGVMKDFNFKSLKQNIEPMVIFNNNSRGRYISIKLDARNLNKSLAVVNEKISSISSNSNFNYFFLDENFDSHYRVEERMQRLFSYFSILAIVIACLGLFGLAAYITEKRTKEIGIRKVMGAEVKQIIIMLSQQFVKWVLIANVIAWPIAYYLLTQWLENFPYRINLGVVPFLASGIIAVIIALSTVTYQTYKAAIANPIDSIINE